MSVIAAKKAQHKKGSESIFIYMGLTFLVPIVIELILYLIIQFPLDTASFVPMLYFLMLSGFSLGIGIYIREHDGDITNIKDWFYAFIFVGILIGVILGAYMW